MHLLFTSFTHILKFYRDIFLKNCFKIVWSCSTEKNQTVKVFQSYQEAKYVNETILEGKMRRE